MRGEDGGFVPVYLYPRSVIDKPPTVKAGHLSVEDEAKNRALACLLIAKAGRMLTLPQSTISCAQVLLHRFYFRVSMHSFKLLRVSMTCVFLASKVEETPVRLRCVLACFDRLLKRRAGLDPTPLSEARFQGWSAAVSSCEGALLRELGFELYIDLPHAFILHFLRYLHPRLDDAPVDEQRVWGDLQQRAWNALNDALFSSRLMFLYQPHEVACAAIFVAASLLGLALPPEWWALFDVATPRLDAAAMDFAALYAVLGLPGAGLEYTPTHADDNNTNNELCVYRIQNRQELLAEKRRKDAELRDAAAASAAAAAAPADIDESKSGATSSTGYDASSTSAPMQS